MSESAGRHKEGQMNGGRGRTGDETACRPLPSVTSECALPASNHLCSQAKLLRKSDSVGMIKEGVEMASELSHG